MDDYTSLILNFYNTMDIFFIVAARVIGFLLILPVFSGSYIPNITRVAFIMLTTALILMFNWENFLNLNIPSNNFMSYTIVLFLEFLTGFILGFSVAFFFNAIYFAGQIIDQRIGYAMVNVLDPMSTSQVPITGNLLYFMSIVFFIQTGSIHLVFFSFFESYNIVPIGFANIFSNEMLFNTFINTFLGFLILGLRISIPIAGTILLVDVALGILVKVNPQMNIFVVGLPIKTIIGLYFLLFILPNMIPIFSEIMTMMMDLFNLALRSLMFSFSNYFFEIK